MYINKKERESFMIMVAAVECLRLWMENEHHLEKGELKSFKTAKTWIEKGLTSFAERIEEDSVKRLKTDAKNCELLLTSKRVKTEDDEIRIKVEDLYNIANQALIICNSGKYCPEKFKKCDMYKAMMDARIPVADLNPEKGKCPYTL